MEETKTLTLDEYNEQKEERFAALRERLNKTEKLGDIVPVKEEVAKIQLGTESETHTKKLFEPETIAQKNQKDEQEMDLTELDKKTEHKNLIVKLNGELLLGKAEGISRIEIRLSITEGKTNEFGIGEVWEEFSNGLPGTRMDLARLEEQERMGATIRNYLIESEMQIVFKMDDGRENVRENSSEILERFSDRQLGRAFIGMEYET